MSVTDLTQAEFSAAVETPVIVHAYPSGRVTPYNDVLPEARHA
jgi:hypothetical protein